MSGDQRDLAQQTQLMPPSRVRRRRRRRALAAGVLLLTAGGFYAWQGHDQAPESEPLIAVARIGSIENTIPASGTLKPRSYVDVGAQVSGQLQRLHVDVGDIVHEGQLLAEIDARVQESRVEASRASLEGQEAQLESRRASLALARANAQRQERLRAANATSELEYETAMTSLASAESSLVQLEKQIEQSRAGLASDETQLEFARIYAPIAGTVVAIEINEGRTLNASQQAPTILRIADLSSMTVETEISEADIGSIASGMDVYFTTLGGGSRRWYGNLRQIRPTPRVTNNVVLYTGLFDVDNTDGMLLPEMTARVFFVSSSAQDVLTVPLGAVRFPESAARAASGRPGVTAAGTRAAVAGGPRGDNGLGDGDLDPAEFPGLTPAWVTVVHADGSLHEREVWIGVTSRITAEVASGLQPGERVVAGVVEPERGTSGARNSGGGLFRALR